MSSIAPGSCPPPTDIIDRSCFLSPPPDVIKCSWFLSPPHIIDRFCFLSPPPMSSNAPDVIKCSWFLSYSTDLPLDKCLEYLTLAVANAKSHSVTIGGRHETAISFLTNLEEKLDVAQVQLEVYNALLPHMNDTIKKGADAQTNADHIIASVVPL
ncbi:hypothetical protein BDR07DRAFT_1498834 [Suillus spraguei]|nr:hypothetical protein BDR07DRAFT_1498834 [Suillus spraguei]